jgi:hypothetical protein
VVAVSSHPARWALREAARASWFPAPAPAADGELLVRFVVGTAPRDVAVGTFSARNASDLTALRTAALDAEAAQYGDLLQLAHEERAGDLSEKTLRLLAAALEFEPRFVVKVDDDTWVDLAALAASLRQRLDVDGLYLGCMRTGSPLTFVGDGATAHLAVGQSLVFADPEPSVLPYAAGQIYALSVDLAATLVAGAHALRRMGNEDVSLGAWLLGLRHSPADEPRFCCASGCAVAAGADAASARLPCIAVVQPACAGVCAPERTLPVLSANCGANGSLRGYARAEQALREGLAEAVARRGGSGGNEEPAEESNADPQQAEAAREADTTDIAA